MRGELEAHVEGRFARLCPTHRRILEGLTCPTGHEVGEEEFDTLDRHTGQVTKATVQPGDVDLTPPRRNPVAALLDRRPRAAAIKEAPMPKEDAQGRKTSKAGRIQTVESARYVDAKGSILFVYLQHVATGDPWRVTWRRLSRAGAKKKTEFGHLFTGDDEATARRHHEQARTQASKEGWRPAVGWQRPLEMRPIPAAARRPGRKPARG